jgi:hypothetical protein
VARLDDEEQKENNNAPESSVEFTMAQQQLPHHVDVVLIRGGGPQLLWEGVRLKRKLGDRIGSKSTRIKKHKVLRYSFADHDEASAFKQFVRNTDRDRVLEDVLVAEAFAAALVSAA